MKNCCPLGTLCFSNSAILMRLEKDNKKISFGFTLSPKKNHFSATHKIVQLRCAFQNDDSITPALSIVVVFIFCNFFQINFIID